MTRRRSAASCSRDAYPAALEPVDDGGDGAGGQARAAGERPGGHRPVQLEQSQALQVGEIEAFVVANSGAVIADLYPPGERGRA
jgi:hypothetical protein